MRFVRMLRKKNTQEKHSSFLGYRVVLLVIMYLLFTSLLSFVSCFQVRSL